MAGFDQAIKVLLEHEGAACVPDDHGRGPSKYGITLATARELHPDWGPAQIAGLDEAAAKEFYRTWLWQRHKIGAIGDQVLATKLIDMAALLGPGTAIRLLQEAVNAKRDGILGLATVAAVASRPPGQVLVAFRRSVARHFIRLAKIHPEWENCLEGWLRRVDA